MTVADVERRIVSLLLCPPSVPLSFSSSLSLSLSVLSPLVINGLRSPIQPSASNGALHLSYSYTISDGLTYTVQTNLSIATNSAFATSRDELGNNYQTVISITGSRKYTYLPTGYTLTSTITGLANVSASSSPHADQRFYPYALLVSSPGVYSINSAPFLDAAGLSFTVNPAVPVNGQVGGATSSVVSVSLGVNATTATAALVEPLSITPPLASLQSQSYTLQ